MSRRGIATMMGEGRYHNLDEVKAVLATEVEKIMAPVAKPLTVDGGKPFVILVVGVNGSGKTTTIGKLAAKIPCRGQDRDARAPATRFGLPRSTSSRSGAGARARP